MVLAFVGVGSGTACMYLSAVTTCAKNFGRGRHKGIALAIPIAAFGLSGMWQSQLGSWLLYERTSNGSRGPLDVFRFFLFLSVLLFAVGLIGGVGLRIVDEDALIDEAAEELERSGLLDERQMARVAPAQFDYGTTNSGDLTFNGVDQPLRRHASAKDREENGGWRKALVLNVETRRFLADHTMWWFAAGFFLVTGPGEAFINNVIPTYTL